jgi:ABC-type transporter Mla MlaB component
MPAKKVKRKRAAAPAAVVVGSPAADSRPTIALASNCNVKDAAELKQSLCFHLESDAPVVLDIGSVERIDTSTIQLLCAFVRDRAAQQRQVEWLGNARVLRDAARLLGVDGLLGVAP